MSFDIHKRHLTLLMNIDLGMKEEYEQKRRCESGGPEQPEVIVMGGRKRVRFCDQAHNFVDLTEE